MNSPSRSKTLYFLILEALQNDLIPSSDPFLVFSALSVWQKHKEANLHKLA